MIKTIIKRDGTKEPYSAHKANGWGEWASETLGDLVDWSDVILQTVAKLPEEVKSETLHRELIQTCLDMDTWSYNMMAGRLYNNLYRKEVWGSLNNPTVKGLHSKLQEVGILRNLSYSDEEYAEIETLIKHERDFKKPHFALSFIRKSYALQVRTKDGEVQREFETPQFVYMRMAMALAENTDKTKRMQEVEDYYEMFSLGINSAPTGNFTNLGTYNTGLAACCKILAGDSLMSLSIADHIATVMTGQSAGIGDKKITRALGDPVRNGSIEHQGGLPYLRVLESAVNANKQGNRGGAATSHIEVYDPDIEVKLALRNPMSTEDKKIDKIDYCYQYNRHFARKAAKNEDIFLFTQWSAPDLWEAMYKGDMGVEFERLYEQYEKDDSFHKKWINARDLLINWMNEAYETNRAYEMNLDEVNYHTPHKDPIYSSNLCEEELTPTKEYSSMLDLYSTEDHGRGEVAICSIGAINVGSDLTDAQYEKAAEYELRMIDSNIHSSSYPLPHVGVTAKARMNAGIGMMGVAELIAKKGLSYTSQEGLEYLDLLAERHAYFLIKASLKLGKEKGNAPWMHKTKWPEGWLPIDTYNKNVDSLVAPVLRYDWDGLRQEIIDNGGIRNCSIVMHMPGEGSSKALGTTGSLYPVRDVTLNKTSGNTAIYWAAPNSDVYDYESVWAMTLVEQTNVYAIFQKWCDQGISGDMFKYIELGEKVDSVESVQGFLYRTKMGLKTRYYFNSTDEMPTICTNCSA